jgi:hypothetical protein
MKLFNIYLFGSHKKTYLQNIYFWYTAPLNTCVAQVAYLQILRRLPLDTIKTHIVIETRIIRLN